MPIQDRYRSGRIGFGSAKADANDQGRQLVVRRRCRVGRRLFVYDYVYVYGEEILEVVSAMGARGG